MAQQQSNERNQDATIYVGNLDEKANEGILWELFLQCGPIVNVFIPKDRVTGLHQGYGFVEFLTEEDAEYAMKIMNMIKLFNKPLRVNKASSDRQTLDVGANLFIGSLDPDVDEKMLYDAFVQFGTLTQTPKVGRDLDTGNSKGYGFVSYDSFEAADAAIAAMNGQYLLNRPITVQYAFKKDMKGERHGSTAERLLAAQSRKAQQAGQAAVPGATAGRPPAQAAAAAAAAVPLAVPPAVPMAAPVMAPGVMPGMPVMPTMPGLVSTAGMMPYYGAPGMPAPYGYPPQR